MTIEPEHITKAVENLRRQDAQSFLDRQRRLFFMLGAWLMLAGWLVGWLTRTPPYGVAVVALFYTFLWFRGRK